MTENVVLTAEEVKVLIRFLWEVNEDITTTHTSNRAFQYLNKHKGTNMSMVAVSTLGQRLSWEVNLPVKLIFDKKIAPCFFDESPNLRNILREIVDPVLFDSPEEDNRAGNIGG